jgi:hypothetical protein
MADCPPLPGPGATSWSRALAQEVLNLRSPRRQNTPGTRRSMQFPPDEATRQRKLPGEAVPASRARGHDVAWARWDTTGASGQGDHCTGACRVPMVVTFDKGFGELRFRGGLAPPAGVILFRLAPRDPSYLARTAVAVIESRDDWTGQFAVVEPGRVRLAPRPPTQNAG